MTFGVSSHLLILNLHTFCVADWPAYWLIENLYADLQNGSYTVVTNSFLNSIGFSPAILTYYCTTILSYKPSLAGTKL